MTRAELRRRVLNLWRPGLEHAALDELREGLLLLQVQASPAPEDGVVRLDDAAPGDYESAMREFFARSLLDESEEGFVQLWLTALELWVAVMTRERRRADDDG